ncbi:hypothetical protein EDD22DRAFT_828603 [Suillus occidentalis]|nr:hypothetical protein EDD22DRAFT_828603 [Suillus occidentalis]
MGAETFEDGMFAILVPSFQVLLSSMLRRPTAKLPRLKDNLGCFRRCPHATSNPTILNIFGASLRTRRKQCRRSSRHQATLAFNCPLCIQRPQPLPGDVLLTLPRPGAPLPNDIGDLAIVPITTYSFEDRKSHNSFSIVALGDGYTYDIPLPDGGDAFWLDSRTIAHVVTKYNAQSLYIIPISTEPLSSDPSSHVGTFPITTASAFRYVPTSSSSLSATTMTTNKHKQ